MQVYAKICMSICFVPVLALLAQTVGPICKHPHLLKHLMARLLVEHLLLKRLVVVKHLVRPIVRVMVRVMESTSVSTDAASLLTVTLLVTLLSAQSNIFALLSRTAAFSGVERFGFGISVLQSLRGHAGLFRPLI